MINRVLFYNSGGGIGDAIQILPLLNTLKTEIKDAKLFYLCAHKNHFNSTLSDFNYRIDSLDLGVKYFGFRWWHALIIKNKIKKYNIQTFDLIIDLQSKIRNSLILKIIPHKYFISTCMNFKLSKPSLDIKKHKKINNTILSAINRILGTNYQLREVKKDKFNFLKDEEIIINNDLKEWQNSKKVLAEPLKVLLKQIEGDSTGK